MLFWVINVAGLVNNNNRECSPKIWDKVGKHVHLVLNVHYVLVLQLGHLHRVPLCLIYFQ